MVKNDKPTLERWVDRMGAALIAPRYAMSVSDTPAGQGRASSDLAILLMLAVFAVETQLLATSGWMLLDGDWMGAVMVFLVGARQHLSMPIILLLGASVVLTIVAGKKRRISDDFDLASVALVPLVFIELLHAIVFRIGYETHSIAVYIGYSWSAGLLGLAYLQTRKRSGERA